MKLILFDIDGTLLHSGGAGKDAMIRAFEEVFGVRNGFAGIRMSGKTDPGILREALERAGLSWDPDAVERFKQRYFELLPEELRKPRPEQRLMPGVRELLEALRKSDHAVIGLLTGNWRQSGFAKLAHFGIADYFELGAFSDDSEEREKLLPFALARLKKQRGVELSPGDVWLVGDTPRDVACGVVHGARVLGVATGRYSPDELLRAGATRVVPDLRDTVAVVDLLLKDDGGKSAES